MAVFDVNYVAVLVAAIAGFVIGFIWYSPKVFGKMWMTLSGIDKEAKEKEKKGMGKNIVFGFISTLVMSFVLAVFIGMAGANTLAAGAQTAFWLWLGFIATVNLGSVLWEGKPFKLYVLNSAHWLVALLVMGEIIAVWV